MPDVEGRDQADQAWLDRQRAKGAPTGPGVAEAVFDELTAHYQPAAGASSDATS